MEKIMQFDLLKSFGYIERVVKPEIFFRKRLIFSSYVHAAMSELPSYLSTMGPSIVVTQPPWSSGNNETTSTAGDNTMMDQQQVLEQQRIALQLLEKDKGSKR